MLFLPLLDDANRTFNEVIIILELKPIVVAIQWALVRTYWTDEPLEW